jgi:site-specific recombinase XerC
MIEAYRDLGRQEIRQRRTGQYTRRITGLPVNQWPDDWKHAWATFVERTNSDALTTSDNAFLDGVALLRALEATSPSDGTQSGSYASATLETWRYAVGQYFGVLEKLGHSLVLDRAAVGVWADAERPYIEPISFATRLAAILQAAQRLFPQQEWEWLVDLVRAGYSVAPGKGAWSPRHADRLVGAGRLRHAALGVLRTVRRKPPTLRTAVEFRDALIILLLTYEPLRRKDLANLPLTAMEWREDGSVSIASSTSKNDQAIDGVLRGHLVECLILWMRRYRSILVAGVAPEAATILVGQGGAPLTAGNLTRLVRAWTAKHLGHTLSPHDVRGAVAYTVVAQEGDVLAASRLLRNRDSRIVERHYSGVAGQVRASKSLDRAVGDICNPSIPTDKRQ